MGIMDKVFINIDYGYRKMASTNQSPQYHKAESRFLSASSDEERLRCLEEMIRECPKHKSAEKMLAQLRIRYRKLKDKMEKVRKVGKARGAKKGIKKEEMQAVLVGFSRSGKSSILHLLANGKSSKIEESYGHSAKQPLVRMMPYSGTGVQIVEIPAIDSENYDKSLANNADTVLIAVNDLGQVRELYEKTSGARGKRIVVFSFAESPDEGVMRKISSYLQSQKYDFVTVSLKTGEGLGVLKDRIFSSFGKIRVFTKEPGRHLSEKSERPIILDGNSMVKDVAEKILHGFSEKVREARIWGPSSKFPGQVVGLGHRLKDLDVVEFRTR
jgi:ribosome-interacting GTPase 1